MKKKIVFIINPISGTSSKKELPALIRQTMDDSWETPEIVYTEYAGHGKVLARQYAEKNFDVVVACGGDGTMNEIASGLIGTQTALSIVPYGSGNGLARHCGFSMTPSKALKQINAGQSQPMDYGMVNDTNFFCTCGTGFDAHISHAFAKEKGRGFLTYLKVILREYLTYKPYTYQLTIDGKTITKQAFVVTFANASQYGNMAYIAPQASIQDGRMDICVIDKFRFYAVPKLAWQLFMKKLDRNKHVTMYYTQSPVQLTRTYEGEFHVDGEAINQGTTMDVKIVSDQLHIWI